MKKALLTGLTALVSASVMSCGNPKFRGTHEFAVGGSLMFSNPSSEFYDPIRRTGPFLLYEGPLSFDDGLDDEYALVGRGRYNTETGRIEIDRAVRVLVKKDDGIEAENGEIFYELVHIVDDNDGIPENNVLILNVYY